MNMKIKFMVYWLWSSSCLTAVLHTAWVCRVCVCLPRPLCVLVMSLCFILCFLSHVCVWSPSVSLAPSFSLHVSSPSNCPHVPLLVIYLSASLDPLVPMSVSFFWPPCQAMRLSLHLSVFPVLFWQSLVPSSVCLVLLPLCLFVYSPQLCFHVFPLSPITLVCLYCVSPFVPSQVCAHLVPWTRYLCSDFSFSSISCLGSAFSFYFPNLIYC